MNRTFSIIFFVVFSLLTIHVSGGEKPSRKEGIKNIPFKKLKGADVGMHTRPGKATINDNVLTLEAGGADIWGTNDEFHFEYTEIKGNFDVSVQVLSLSKAHQYTKAGIMARAALADDCAHIYFQVFPDNSPRNKNNGGCEFQYRKVKAEKMKAIYPDMATAGNKFDVNFPSTWIRLKREGNVFTSYMSGDNKNWHQYSVWEQNMPEKLLVGLAVTAHNPDKNTIAGFSGFQLINK